MTVKPQISIIVAIADDYAIGKNNKLLTYLPNDLKWFKKNTLEKTVIMGRKTFESLPNGALPKRTNIVLSKNKDFNPPNCVIFNDLDTLISNLKTDEENFVIGGAEIYELFLPFADKLYITRIHSPFEADVYFPELNFDDWELVEKIENSKDEKNNYDYDFLVYKKKNRK